MARLSEALRVESAKLFSLGHTKLDIAEATGVAKTTIGDFLRKDTHKDWWEVNYPGAHKEKCVIGHVGPKILILDIETAPVLGNVWRLFKQNVGLNQIEQDWYTLSWAAKWYHDDEVMYEDKSQSWDTDEDFHLIQGIWNLLDEADVIITQNGKRFDVKKLNARFILNGMKPPSSFRHIDVLEIAKKHFGFTSNKLEYMTNALCKKYKKLTHGKFPGFELWKGCLAGDQEAWDEMKDYNIHDVLSLEELSDIIRPWYSGHPNFNLYYDDLETRCSACGGMEFVHNGYDRTNLSKFDRFQCTGCGHEHTSRVNLLSKEKRQSLKRNVK